MANATESSHPSDTSIDFLIDGVYKDYTEDTSKFKDLISIKRTFQSNHQIEFNNITKIDNMKIMKIEFKFDVSQDTHTPFCEICSSRVGRGVLHTIPTVLCVMSVVVPTYLPCSTQLRCMCLVRSFIT